MPSQKRLAQFGPEVAFNRSLLFDEKAVLEQAMPYITRQLGFTVQVVPVDQAIPDAPGHTSNIVESAEPGSPGIVFYNTEA